jgi:hypothetical protein
VVWIPVRWSQGFISQYGLLRSRIPTGAAKQADGVIHRRRPVRRAGTGRDGASGFVGDLVSILMTAGRFRIVISVIKLVLLLYTLVVCRPGRILRRRRWMFLVHGEPPCAGRGVRIVR